MPAYRPKMLLQALSLSPRQRCRVHGAAHLGQALHLADTEASGGVVARHQEVFLLDADGLAPERGVQHLFHLNTRVQGSSRSSEGGLILLQYLHPMSVRPWSKVEVTG